MKLLSPINVIKDNRAECYSLLTTTNVGDYLNLVDETYQNRGGLEGQRGVLKTKSARKIRERMVDDIQKGTVFPPVVIGLLVSDKQLKEIEIIEKRDFEKLLSDIPNEKISIIDGIQRTTALKEAAQGDEEGGKKYRGKDVLERPMRVEFWIASSVNSLIYRMLVLNSGQVPWNLRRQIGVVYASLLEEIKPKVTSLSIIKIDDNERRTNAGKFKDEQIMQMYLIFGTRQVKINIEEQLTEEFKRLDFTEATSDKQFTNMFCEVLQLLVNLDLAFERYKSTSSEKIRFQNGRDLFSSQTAQAGFIAAMALEIFGRPGAKERTQKEKRGRLDKLKTNTESLLKRIEKMKPEILGEFLDFDTLNENTAKMSGKVGDFERPLFEKAFSILISEGFAVDSLTVCWRADG